MMAGALTPTEIIEAWKAGSDLVKVFPCSSVGGAAYIKALRGPLPQIPDEVRVQLAGRYVDLAKTLTGEPPKLVVGDTRARIEKALRAGKYL